MSRQDWMMILVAAFAIGQVFHWFGLWRVGQSTGAFPKS